MSIREELQLDQSSAAAEIVRIGDQLSGVANAFRDELSSALSSISGARVDFDTSSVAQEILDAVEEARPQPIEVDADVSQIDDEVSQAFGQLDLFTIPVEVDTSGVTDAEASIAEQLTLFDATITPTVDASGADEQLQSLLDVVSALTDQVGIISLDADASGAQDQIGLISSTVDAIAGQLIDLSANVDVSSAESALDDLKGSIGDVQSNLSEIGTSGDSGLNDLGKSADQVSGQVGKTAQSVSGLATNAGTSATSVGALTGSIGGMASSVPVLGGVAAAFAGVAAFTDKAAESAINVQASLIRENQTFGEFSSAVEHIQVGSLNADLADLNFQLGSSTSQTRQAAATAGNLAKGFGLSGEKSAEFAAQVVALSARAVALNPSLGQVGDVAERLNIGLGRSRGLAQYGISLSQSEINARASANAQGKLASELSPVEKAVAGAQLAVEKFGPSLKQNVADASLNPQIQMRQFQVQIQRTIAQIGQPLIAPLFDVIRESQPVLQEGIKLLGEVGKDTLPAIAEAAKDAAPGIAAFTRAMTPLLETLSPILVLLAKLSPAITPVTSLLSRFGIGSDQAASSQSQLQGALGGTVGALDETGQAAQGAGDAVGSSTVQFDKLQGGLLGVVDAQHSLEESARSIDDAQRGVATASQGVVDARRGEVTAARGVVDAERGIVTAQRGVIDAQRSYQTALIGVTEAERSRIASIRALGDAQTNLVNAQRALTEAQSGTSERDQLSIDQARLSLTEAQRRADELAGDQTADAVARERSQLDVRSQRLALHDAEVTAAGRVTDAQKGVQDAQEKLTSAQDAVEKSTRGVVAAQDAVTDSLVKVGDAQLGVSSAAQRVVDARDAVGAAHTREADAERAVRDAIRSVGDAQDDQARKALAFLDSQTAFGRSLGEQAGGADALIGRLEEVKAKFPETAGAVDPLIQKFRDLKDTVPATGQDVGAQLADGIAAGAGTAGVKTQESVGTGLKGIDFSLFLPEFTSGLGVIRDGITSTVSTWKDDVLGWVDTAKSEAPGKISELAGNFGTGLLTIGTTIFDSTINFADNVTGWIGTAITESPAKLALLAGEIVGGIARQGVDLAQAVIGFPGNVLGWIDTATTEGPLRLLGLGIAIKDGVLGIGGQIVEGTANFVGNLYGWTVTAVTEGPGKLEDAARPIVIWAAGLPGRVASGIGDLAGLLIGKGKDIIRGLLRGVEDIVRKLPDFLGPIKDRFIEGFNEAFEASSPARVMIPVGENIGGGVLLGLSSAGEGVVAEAERIAQAAAAAVVPDIKVPALATSVASSLSPAALKSPAGAIVAGPFTFDVAVTMAGGTPQDAAAAGAAFGHSAGESIAQVLATVRAA